MAATTDTGVYPASISLARRAPERKVEKMREGLGESGTTTAVP